MSLEKIIYVADPMCSWCWGFSPQIRQLRASLADKVEFSLIMGGLRDGHEWDDDFRKYLAENWKKVSTLTGQPFSTRLFEKRAFNYTTEPACRAVVTVRDIDEASAFEAFFTLQHAFYTEGKDITREDVIETLLAPLNIQGFADTYGSASIRELTRQDKNRARLYGATSFPSLVILDDQGHLSVIRGYRTFEELTRMLVK